MANAGSQRKQPSPGLPENLWSRGTLTERASDLLLVAVHRTCRIHSVPSSRYSDGFSSAAQGACITWSLITITFGLSRWLSGKEFNCQCRRHGFNPWSGKTPHAEMQLTPRATTTEPVPCSPRTATIEPLCSGYGNPHSRACTMLSCFSCVRLCVILQTVALQSPLSMRFSRQECWSGLPFPSPGDLPNPRIKPASLTSNLHQLASSSPLDKAPAAAETQHSQKNKI